jgi:hypothetical protein
MIRAQRVTSQDDPDVAARGIAVDCLPDGIRNPARLVAEEHHVGAADAAEAIGLVGGEADHLALVGPTDAVARVVVDFTADPLSRAPIELSDLAIIDFLDLPA